MSTHDSLIVSPETTRKAGALAGLGVLAVPGSGDADAAVARHRPGRHGP